MKSGVGPVLLLLVISVTAVESQITKGPANALKNVGDNVTMECVTSSRNCDQVEWMKVEGAQSARAVYSHDIILNSFPGERYSVNGTGGCNLTITQLEVNDSGRFSCVLLVNDMEETRSSVLVVINVTESCQSNVTSNGLTEGDGYSFWTTIKVPPKSVEPSNVTLSFINKTADETEKMDDSQPLTVKTTLTVIARKENITQRVCRASLPPNTADGSDRTIATLDVCNTSMLIKGPMNALKKFGDNVTLECDTSSKNCENVEWKKTEGQNSFYRTVYTNGIILDGFSRERYSVNRTGGCNLTITQLKINDSGNFICELTVGSSQQKKGAVLVVIAVLSKGTVDVLKKVGDSVTLACVKNRNNCDQVVWMKIEGAPPLETVFSNGTILSDFPSERYSVNRSVGCDLTIKQLEVNDSGRFICVLTTGGTQKRIDFNLTAVQPQILEGPVNALKNVGDSVRLDCVTSIYNCDQVKWTMERAHSPKIIYDNDLGMLNNVDFPHERYCVSSAGGCHLTIRVLEFDDSGRFSCVLKANGRNETKSSVLLVVDGTKVCQSNVSSNALNQNDSYSFWAAINVPAKFMEPSNVTLSFQNKTVGEIETMDNSQSRTINTTVTGIARNENITRVCMASLPPNTADDFDRSTATLVVCTTQLIVSFPVERVTVWPNAGKFHEGTTISCIARGYPIPTFSWEIRSGLHQQLQNGSSLNITKGSFGKDFGCLATNTVNGKKESKQMIVMVSKHSDESDTGDCVSGCIAGNEVGTVLFDGVEMTVATVKHRKISK